MNLLLLKNNIYILITALNKDPVKPSSNTVTLNYALTVLRSFVTIELLLSQKIE